MKRVAILLVSALIVLGAVAILWPAPQMPTEVEKFIDAERKDRAQSR